jgi:hypothetical protein
MSIEETGVFAINVVNTKLYDRELKPEELLSGTFPPPAGTQVLIEALQKAENEESTKFCTFIDSISLHYLYIYISCTNIYNCLYRTLEWQVRI